MIIDIMSQVELDILFQYSKACICIIDTLHNIYCYTVDMRIAHTSCINIGHLLLYFSFYPADPSQPSTTLSILLVSYKYFMDTFDQVHPVHARQPKLIHALNDLNLSDDLLINALANHRVHPYDREHGLDSTRLWAVVT